MSENNVYGGYTVAYRSLLEGALVLVLLLPVAGTQVRLQPLVLDMSD